METHVLLTFSNLILSSNPSNASLQMELSYETKKIKFEYPQTEPLKLSFSQKFIHDKINLVLSTQIESGTNKKKIIPFRGDITLNKTIFSDNNKSVYEKNITMIPIEPIKEIKEMKENKKIGKILMQIQLLDPFEEWKKNFKNLNKKKTGGKLKNNSLSMNNNNDSISNNINANLNINNSNSKNANKSAPIKNQKKSPELLSEITVEAINEEENDESKAINELNKLISLENISKLKEILKNDYKKIFPNDINSLKAFNENLYQKYYQLSIKYNELLQALNNDNENMRKKAVDYYKEYKDLKSKLAQKMNENKKVQKNNDNNEILKKRQENDKLINNSLIYNNQIDFFLKKLLTPKQEEKKTTSQKNENEAQAISSATANNPEIKMLKDAIKKISSMGYDLFVGLNITEEEKKLLNMLLDMKESNDEKKNKANPQKEKKKDHDKEADKEDYDLSNQIVGLIERDVNDLYMRKLIEQVKIDQIDAITYSFKGNTKSKEVEFKIENNNLVCDTGESFTVWLISNFSL